ncbi:hypothetical protein [Amycolatopsis sp. NPDC004079]|uniref:hypothetical protein n=1 Tax=Amycolatopsis sp. NPDC004079 TaxID=3154549 RepID=UPI0033AC34AC
MRTELALPHVPCFFLNPGRTRVGETFLQFTGIYPGTPVDAYFCAVDRPLQCVLEFFVFLVGRVVNLYGRSEAPGNFGNCSAKRSGPPNDNDDLRPGSLSMVGSFWLWLKASDRAEGEQQILAAFAVRPKETQNLSCGHRSGGADSVAAFARRVLPGPPQLLHDRCPVAAPGRSTPAPALQ